MNWQQANENYTRILNNLDLGSQANSNIQLQPIFDTSFFISIYGRWAWTMFGHTNEYLLAARLSICFCLFCSVVGHLSPGERNARYCHTNGTGNGGTPQRDLLPGHNDDCVLHIRYALYCLSSLCCCEVQTRLDQRMCVANNIVHERLTKHYPEEYILRVRVKSQRQKKKKSNL